MALTDDVQQIVAILTDMHVGGAGERLRRAAGVDATVIAKAAGTTADAVYMWERGELKPTTHQALAWLGFLHDRHGDRASASAQYLRGLHQAVPEAYAATMDGMRADLATLRREFPEWELEPPSNFQAVENGAPGAGKLRHFSAISPDGEAFSAATVAELRTRIVQFVERGAA